MSGTVKVVQVTRHPQACNKVADKILTIATWGLLSPLATHRAQDMVDPLDHLQDHRVNNSQGPQQVTLVSKNIIGKIR